MPYVEAAVGVSIDQATGCGCEYSLAPEKKDGEEFHPYSTCFTLTLYTYTFVFHIL